MAAFAQMVGTYLRVAKAGGDEVRHYIADQATRDKKVVLFLDEAQLVGEDQRPGLGLLHTTGLGFPTVAMLAGLSHTSGRLRGPGGLSRLADNAIVNMGAMTEGECAESTALLLDACGAEGDSREKERACGTVAELSHGWPQHLNGAQRALGRELLSTGGVLAGVNFGAVRSESDRIRRNYYRARLSDTVLDIVPAATARIVAEVTETRPGRMYELEGVCEDVIADMGLDKDGRFRTDAEEFAKTLVERGVLAITPGGSYDVAIPSMLDHLNEISQPASPN